MFENKVLKKIYGRKYNEMTQKWRIMDNEDLPELYDLSDDVKIIK